MRNTFIDTGVGRAALAMALVAWWREQWWWRQQLSKGWWWWRDTVVKLTQWL